MAKPFVILTQSSCDLSAKRFVELDVLVAPIPFTINGKAYKHDPHKPEISQEEFYQQLRAHADIKTASPSIEDFIHLAQPALEQGQDVLYLGISSALSATFQAASLAMDELRERYKDRTIHCIDTKSGAMGESLLVEMAAQARNSGLSLDETVELIEKNKLNTAHIFTLDQLEYLRRSGRLPAYQAVLGSILQIKPILQLNMEGGFELAGKVRTYQKALNRLYELVVNKAVNLKEQVVYISHADVRQAAEALAEKIRQAGAKGVVVNKLGPAIAAHFGVGGIGVSFLSATRV